MQGPRLDLLTLSQNGGKIECSIASRRPAMCVCQAERRGRTSEDVELALQWTVGLFAAYESRIELFPQGNVRYSDLRRMARTSGAHDPLTNGSSAALARQQLAYRQSVRQRLPVVLLARFANDR